MPKIGDPSTSELRDNLAEYIAAVKEGKEFSLFTFNTPIGRVGHPDAMPKQFIADAYQKSFSDIRDESSLLRRAMLRGRGVIVVRHARGQSGGRGRRQKSEPTPVLAVWPMPEGGAIAAVTGELRDVSSQLEALESRVSKFIDDMTPLVKLLKELDLVEKAIKEKRTINDNLDATKSRLLKSAS